MSYTTVAVIFNPNSTGSSKQAARQFKADFEKQYPDQVVDLMPTERRGHAEELAYMIASSSTRPLIISSSGDGGYNEVVNGAMRAQQEGHTPVLGLLPAGNANDHHRSLDDSSLIEAIKNNSMQDIDLLKITYVSKGEQLDRYAHSYIGFGLTPWIGRKLNQTKVSPFNESWLVLRELFSAKPVRLKLDGKVKRYESVICSNIDSMSKVLKVSQPSSITDGRFEVTIFNRQNKFKLLFLLIRASLAGLVEDRQVRSISIGTIDKTIVQVDGEIITLDAETETVIEAQKQTLTCYV